jgi:hypothetical protein
VLRREKRRGLWEGGGEAGEVAASLVRHARTFTGTDGASYAPESPAEQAAGRTGSQGQGGTREHIAEACSALPWPPVLIAQDAAVDVGSVAGWAWAQQMALRNKPLFATERGDWRAMTGDGERRADIDPSAPFPVVWPCLLWPTAALTLSASIPPPPLPAGTVCYIDPPYLNTTGYKHALDRAAVIEIARSWHHAGARVYISEAEPITALGWHHVEISGERKGQARTFGATPEWLTCSHRPAWTPPQQSTLFTRHT